jgi:hypothetical protein
MKIQIHYVIENKGWDFHRSQITAFGVGRKNARDYWTKGGGEPLPLVSLLIRDTAAT